MSCVSGVPRCARCVRFDTYVIDCFNGIKRRLCKHATARSQVGEATAATQEAKEAACCGVFLWRGGGLSKGSSWTLSDPHFSLPVPSKVGTRDIEDIDIEDRNIDKRTCLLCHSAFDKIMITKTCFGEETMETVDVKERM